MRDFIKIFCGWCGEVRDTPGFALPDGWVMFDDLMNLQLCCSECAKNNLPEYIHE